MKKYLYLAAALGLAVAPVTVACAKSAAPKVEKISKEDMLQLTIDAMSLDKIQQAANDAAKGAIDDRAKILAKYGLDWQKLGGPGAEQYVEPDGTIHRKAPAAPDMGAAPAKGKK